MLLGVIALGLYIIRYVAAATFCAGCCVLHRSDQKSQTKAQFMNFHNKFNSAMNMKCNITNFKAKSGLEMMSYQRQERGETKGNQRKDSQAAESLCKQVHYRNSELLR